MSVVLCSPWGGGGGSAVLGGPGAQSLDHRQQFQIPGERLRGSATGPAGHSGEPATGVRRDADRDVHPDDNSPGRSPAPWGTSLVLARPNPPGSDQIRSRSSRRDRIPSLAYTFPRWYSTAL